MLVKNATCYQVSLKIQSFYNYYKCRTKEMGVSTRTTCLEVKWNMYYIAKSYSQI